ncbi:MAG: chymotrypsin family serine protease [Dethiobacteraceae bacterium]
MEKNIYQLDAALARPLAPTTVRSEVLEIGEISGLANAELALWVKKSGRSTGYTTGRVAVIGATVNIGFSFGRSAQFTQQIITSKMGEAGDSGSLLLDGANRAVGLLFAGSAKATIFHPIADVLQALNIRLTTHADTLLPQENGEFRSLFELCQFRGKELLQLPNVVGVGIGKKIKANHDTGKLCITVLVARKLAATLLREEEIVPAMVGAIPTDVVESGRLTADFQGACTNQRLDRRVKMRPAQPGISIGHYFASTGTFGAVAYDNQSGEKVILSNNHVLANATNGSDSLARVGDPILQPGRQDGGQQPGDVIGTLLRVAPLHFSK